VVKNVMCMKRAGARLLPCGMHTNWGRRAGVGVGRVIALWHNNDGSEGEHPD